MKKKLAHYIFIVLGCSSLLGKAQLKPLRASDEEPVFYIGFQESYYAPFTNTYIYGFPNTSVLFSFSPRASDSFFSVGFSYSRNHSDYMGFHAKYKYLSNYGNPTPHNFVFSAGYKYLFGQYHENSNGFSYDHRVSFHNIYFGIGYQYFFGKNQLFFIAPMAHLSANFVNDDLDKYSGKGSPNYEGFYKKKIDGLLAPYLELEFGIKLKGGRN